MSGFKYQAGPLNSMAVDTRNRDESASSPGNQATCKQLLQPWPCRGFEHTTSTKLKPRMINFNVLSGCVFFACRTFGFKNKSY